MNLWSILDDLAPHDEIKFVVGNEVDYSWAKERIAEHDLHHRHTVLFSPVFGDLAPQDLADWILADRLPVRLQLQLHKFIWDPEMRGV